MPLLRISPADPLTPLVRGALLGGAEQTSFGLHLVTSAAERQVSTPILRQGRSLPAVLQDQSGQ